MFDTLPRGTTIYPIAYIYKIQSLADESTNFFCASTKKNPKVNNPELKASGYKRIIMGTYYNIRRDDLNEILSHFIEDYPNINKKKFTTPPYRRCHTCFNHYCIKSFHKTDTIHIDTLNFKEKISVVLQQFKIRNCKPNVIQQPIHSYD